MNEDICWLSAAELGRLYRSGELSPVEVVSAALDRIDRIDPVLNFMVTTVADQARDDAKTAERDFREGRELPPLHGVPMTVKDLTETAGVRTTYGCVAYADFVPDYDAVGWARLKEQGVILLGKTTTPEFGLIGVTESKLTGSTSTPWRPGYNAGGSSGGAAAAVVAGVGPIAWGSDGGGSIRVPSSLCGAVGIKPSLGRIPTLNGVDGDETDGPIARTVLDAAMVLDATVGHDPADRFSVPREPISYTEAALAPGNLTGVRIAACYDLGQKVLDPEVSGLFTAALSDLRAAGAVVEESTIELPDTTTFFNHVNSHDYQKYVEELQAEGVELWPAILEMARRAHDVTGRQVSDAFRSGKTAIYNAFRKALGDAQVLVSPTTPIPAFQHSGSEGPMRAFEGHEAMPLGPLLHSMTEPPSHAGLPAITVPCGFTADGLPVGLQIIGRLWADADVISVAARYQRFTSWHTSHPVL